MLLCQHSGDAKKAEGQKNRRRTGKERATNINTTPLGGCECVPPSSQWLAVYFLRRRMSVCLYVCMHVCLCLCTCPCRVWIRQRQPQANAKTATTTSRSSGLVALLVAPVIPVSAIRLWGHDIHHMTYLSPSDSWRWPMIFYHRSIPSASRKKFGLSMLRRLTLRIENIAHKLSCF